MSHLARVVLLALLVVVLGACVSAPPPQSRPRPRPTTTTRPPTTTTRPPPTTSTRPPTTTTTRPPATGADHFALFWSSEWGEQPSAYDYTSATGRDLISVNPWMTPIRDDARAAGMRAVVYMKPNETGTPFGSAPPGSSLGGGGFGGTERLDTSNANLQAAWFDYIDDYLASNDFDGIWIDNVRTMPFSFLVASCNRAHSYGKSCGGNIVAIYTQADVDAIKSIVNVLDYTMNEFWMGGRCDGSSWDNGGEAVAGALADYANSKGKEWHARVCADPSQLGWLRDAFDAFERHNPDGLGRFDAVECNVCNDATRTWRRSDYT